MDSVDENGILEMLNYEMSQKSYFGSSDEDEDSVVQPKDSVVQPEDDSQNREPNLHEINISTESFEVPSMVVVIESNGVTVVEELAEFLRLPNLEEETPDEECQTIVVDGVSQDIIDVFEDRSEDGSQNGNVFEVIGETVVSQDGNHVFEVRSEHRQNIVDESGDIDRLPLQNIVDESGDIDRLALQNIVDESGDIDRLPLQNIVDESGDIDRLALQNIVDESGDIDRLPLQKRVRKTIPHPENWKRNQRQRNHQAGEEYVSQKGKLVPKKQLMTKKDCLNSCKFKCNKKITNEEREAIFKGYYSLRSQFEKSLFLKSTTERTQTVRRKCTNKDDEQPKRNFSFHYYFSVKGQKIQVCKTYFLSTLSISQKPVYNVHDKMDPETGIPKTDGRGKLKVNLIPEYAKNDIRNHIKSFPVVESHYCRKDTSKQYLDSSLSIAKMYSLFLEKYPNTVIKESMYRRIFVTEFNFDFHTPKSDRCDVCEEYKVCVKEGLPINTEIYENHILQKDVMRGERNQDRESLKENKRVPVLCFDLQNVITCPRAEISSLFYYCKLNVYNLTAHLNTGEAKRVYCAIWTEVTGGRSGNDIASAIFKILKRVLSDFPHITDLITWSDSCVPQNRNQMIVGALMLLMKQNPSVNSVTMKYSTPGHGAVQEVDNVHSHIEKSMVATEFYSPVGFIRILKNVNKKNPFTVLQMTDNDFLDFAVSSKKFFFQSIPFTKIVSLKVTQVLGEIQYNEFHGEILEKVNIKDFEGTAKGRKARRKSKENCAADITYEDPPKIRQLAKLRPEKKRDINRMMKFMPLVDREYFKTILNAH